jgi:hypothetical protein
MIMMMIVQGSGDFDRPAHEYFSSEALPNTRHLAEQNL